MVTVLTLFCFMAGDCVVRTGQAQETMQKEGTSSGPADLDTQIQTWAKRLAAPAENNEIGRKFLAAIQKPSGRIAMASQISVIEEELRRQAANEALPGFLDETFERQGDKYVLRSEAAGFAENLQVDAKQFDDDVAELSAKLKEVASKMGGESDADLLLARALENELVPAYIYIRQLREALHPGVALIQQRLASAFAVDRDGKLFVREQAVEAVTLLVEQLRRAEQVFPKIQDEFHQLGAEIFAADDFHADFKRRLAGDTSAAYISVELTGTDRLDLNELVNSYFQSLEPFFLDTADGLIIQPEQLDRLKEAMNRNADVRRSMEVLKEPLVEFAEMIDETRSPLDGEIKQLLLQPIGLVAVAKRVDAGMVNIERYVQNIVDQTLETADDGTTTVRTDRQEAVARYAQELLRGGREIRRQLNVSNEIVENLADEKLQETMMSLSGRFVVMQSIRKRSASIEIDALGEFTSRFFDDTANGLVAKPEAEAMMTQVIEQAARIESELGNDDF